MLGGIQGTEWIILILIVVFFLFGAKKLPELARSIGKATGEFQKGKMEIEREISQVSSQVDQVSSQMSQAVRAPISTLEKGSPQSPQTAPYVHHSPPAPATVTPPSQTPTTSPPQPPAERLEPAASQVEPPGDEKERLFKAAKELGISPEGKSLQQLKDEITRSMLG